jgi:mono/diheme cytochrome c family protein
MGGGGGDDAAPASTAPATTESADAPAPAAAPAAAVPATPAVAPPPAPITPWVEAATTRKKIPFWAVPVLFALPLWAVIYALTLDPPTDANGPLTIGDQVYNQKGCSGCHGGTGGGNGNIPALAGGPTAATKVFPRPADQVAWVALGSAGWLATGQKTLPDGLAVKGGMPAWSTSLTPDELMAVVLHERAAFNSEPFDAATWEDGFADTMKKYVPDQADAYVKVLEEWKANPPT